MKKKHKTGLVLRAQRSAAPPRGKAFLSALLPAALLSLGLAQTAASVVPSGVSNGWAAAAILFAFSPALLALAQTKAAPWMLAAGVLVLGAAAAIFFAPLRDGFCALGNDILSVLPEKTGRIHMLWDVENTANARAAALFLAAATELLLCTGAVPSLIVAALFALGAAAGIVPAGWGAAALGSLVWGALKVRFPPRKSERPCRSRAEPWGRGGGGVAFLMDRLIRPASSMLTTLTLTACPSERKSLTFAT